MLANQCNSLKKKNRRNFQIFYHQDRIQIWIEKKNKKKIKKSKKKNRKSNCLERISLIIEYLAPDAKLYIYLVLMSLCIKQLLE